VDRELAREAAEVLAAVRARLDEWAEEGVESVPAATAADAGAPAPPAPSRTGAHGAAEAPSGPPGDRGGVAGAQLDILGGATEFGAHPTLERVREVLGECTRCGLAKGRTTIVFGDGHPHADLLFVGEGPGEQEDLQGLPFVGRAGELLTRMIEKGLGISRRDVYICNLVKCRPPNNRTPLASEVAACRPFLDGQIAAVGPRVIVALGKPATSLLLGRDVSITRLRGTWHEYRGIPLMPTFHPAFVLRQYTEENRRLVWQDLRAALARARGA
jgi:uracil-DNA glycosylase